MQTILGAGGVIGTELAKSLPQFTDRIRLVARHPRKVNAGDELFAADLLNAGQTSQAVAGSEVVYLTAGLPYNLKIWQDQWPRVMRNVLDACKKHRAKFVFFDNVYCYGRVNGWMTESTLVKPASRKGFVRAQIAEMVMEEITQGNIQSLIARSADFYGPNTPLSFVNVMIFENLRKGKKAQWMINDTVKHSLTYTPDAGKATALLGNTDAAYGQIWHLPTDRNALTGRELIEMAAREFNVKPGHTTLPRWMLQMAGLFSGIIRESVEMLYQNESDYLFDSSKFDKAFDFKTTSYEQGVKETVRSMR